GATVLFVSHDLASVQRLCTRVIWIERGRLRADGEPLPLIKAYSDQVRREQDQRLLARDRKQVPGQDGTTRSVDEYGNRKVVLRSVRFLDAAGQERRVFQTGEGCIVELG